MAAFAGATRNPGTLGLGDETGFMGFSFALGKRYGALLAYRTLSDKLSLSPYAFIEPCR